MKKCDFCDKETNNPRFCSRSCAAKKTNKESIKRKKSKKCKCGTFILSNRKNCATCKGMETEAIKDLTLEDYQNSMSAVGKHPSWKHAQIRQFCRYWNKELKKLPCQRKNCAYSLHVELCHVRAIADFPPTTTLREVNDPKNIRVLCPNCHWEFDNFVIDLEDLNRR